MKITVQKSIIENILVNAQAFLEKKDTSQITSHIYMDVFDSVLTLKATDYEIGLLIKTDKMVIEKNGAVTANGKKFLDIVRILKDGEINLESKNDMLYISQAHSNFKLPTFSFNEFPEFPSYEGKDRISINSHSLIDSLKKITPAIDTNNPKFELNGACIDIKQDSINFASTDTRRLAVVNIVNNSTQELSLIIPKKAIIEIQKLFINQLNIYYDKTTIIIQNQNYYFFSRLINSKYPNYERIIPKDIKYILKIPKQEMLNSIRMVNTVSEEIKITFTRKSIIFNSLSADNTDAKTELFMDTELDNFELNVNSRFFLDFISLVNDNEFEILLNKPSLPFILKDKQFITVIMPIIV